MNTDRQVEKNGNLPIFNVRHSAFGWFIRKPLKLIKYYCYLKRIYNANKGIDYDYPELNWYMLN